MRDHKDELSPIKGLDQGNTIKNSREKSMGSASPRQVIFKVVQGHGQKKKPLPNDK